MGKADVIKRWKPEMKELGFVYRDNMFQFKETIDQCLQFAISIQRNLHSETYMIHVSILISNPFVQNSRQQILVPGRLRAEGVYLHVLSNNWWPPESLPEALTALKRFALPWFREWSKPGFLVEKFETAIRERKHLIEVFEPLTPEQEEPFARLWHRPDDANRHIPTSTFFHASILHYLASNTEMAIVRTKDWLALLGPDEKTERDQAQAQLTSLDRIHEEPKTKN